MGEFLHSPKEFTITKTPANTDTENMYPGITGSFVRPERVA